MQTKIKTHIHLENKGNKKQTFEGPFRTPTTFVQTKIYLQRFASNSTERSIITYLASTNIYTIAHFIKFELGLYLL